MTARNLWTVRYRRTNWEYRQSRFFKSEQAARRFMDRLTRDDYDLDPLDHLSLERNALGPVEVVESWHERL